MMSKRKAFTIVELLTSLVIIALLLGILLPSISAVRRSAKDTAQRAQLNTIEMALETFKQDYGDYPPSSQVEENILPQTDARDYCGSMKLAEALLGWDLQGFHPKTFWRRDGFSGTNVAFNGPDTYDPLRTRLTATNQFETLFERKGPYLELAKTPVFHIGVTGAGKNDGLYKPPNANLPLFDARNFVICDVFGVRKLNDAAGKTVMAGSPILYYKANTASKNITDINFNKRIYVFGDNRNLLLLGKLNASGAQDVLHPISFNDGPNFYNDKFTYTPATAPGYGGSGIGYGIKDPKVSQITNVPWPYRPDSYILISAGADGLYGTADDIHNY